MRVMAACRCPSCSRLIELRASDFGEESGCPHCQRVHAWDVEHLARFELAERFRIRVVESDGAAWRGPALPLFLSHWAELPPLWTSTSGLLIVARETIEFAYQVESELYMMDRRGDPTHVRFVEVRAFSREDADDRAQRRRGSGWPMSRLESRYFESMDALIAAYRLPLGLEIKTSLTRIDLEERVRDVEATMKIMRT